MDISCDFRNGCDHRFESACSSEAWRSKCKYAELKEMSENLERSVKELGKTEGFTDKDGNTYVMLDDVLALLNKPVVED